MLSSSCFMLPECDVHYLPERDLLDASCLGVGLVDSVMMVSRQRENAPAQMIDVCSAIALHAQPFKLTTIATCAKEVR